MKKMKLHTPNLTEANIERIREIFPNCVTEAHDGNGQLRLAVDFDQLRQELSDHIVEGPRESYHLNWPGKRQALLMANAPIAKTLRPCREESVDFDTTENLFIEGDNLDALKLLRETYLGKIKMIYIDPPYNTGKDFVYQDRFAESTEEYLLESEQKDGDGNHLVANMESDGRFHSKWLTMMYPRLKLARNLLKDDGVIFISIDDNEVSNLRKICDEIFGAENFIANIIWNSKYTLSNDAKRVSTQHENILFYAKDIEEFAIGLLPRTEQMDKAYKNPDNDPKGPWKATPLHAKSGRDSDRYSMTFSNGVTWKCPAGRFPRYRQSRLIELYEDGQLWFGKNGKRQPNKKTYLSEVKKGKTVGSMWDYQSVGSTHESNEELSSVFGKGVFPNPKGTKLLERIITVANVSSDDLILDFFAGSATTAQAVMQLNTRDGGNRKFIMIQFPEKCDEESGAFTLGYKTIAEISKERIRLAGRSIKDENAIIAPNLDIGFRVLKIDSSSMADVYYAPDSIEQGDLLTAIDNIKPGRDNPEDLLFQVMLDWGVDLTLPIRRETIQNKTVLLVDDNALIACFDTGITENLVKKLAAYKPHRVVFRDKGFTSDTVKINVDQIFRQLSPTTEAKSI